MALFVYVDNSTIWIEGQRLSAVKRGLAPNIGEAMARGITDRDWRYDFGRLYQLACPLDQAVGRSILFGSRPPSFDTLWTHAREQGFEVEVYDRNAANKEKRVDTGLVTVLLDDSYQHMRSERGDMAVIVGGDGDYVPPAESITQRGIKLRVVCWRHATSGDLAGLADEYITLDGHLDELAA